MLSENTIGQSMTEEEYTLIKDYCILPFVKNMVITNSDKIKEEGMTLGQLFVRSSLKVIQMIDDDINRSRMMVGKLKAKITEVNRNDEGILYEVELRGYVHRVALLRHVVRQEMADRRDKYIANLFKYLSQIG
ncbi:hypothetical protein [Paenibacillus glycanilyticus]|uniref:hypothetical protein n=1 Tax=Paenibacillus glycanilyticus TaxID=126569 RepID=UPI000FD762AE|nr:hypothetical protein [Paenibacillus glycanilyticus]